MSGMTGHDAEIGGHVGPKYPPLMVSARALTLLCQGAAVSCPKSARIKGYSSRTM